MTQNEAISRLNRLYSDLRELGYRSEKMTKLAIGQNLIRIADKLGDLLNDIEADGGIK